MPYHFATPGEPPSPHRYVEFRVDQSDLDAAFRHLARCEEYDVTIRDKYERFLWEHTTTDPREDAARPLVSELGRQMLATLNDEARRAGLPFISKEAWPGGKAMAACLTHDVDSVSRGKLPRGIAVRDITRAASNIARGRFDRAARETTALFRTAAGPNPHWSFDRISAMEQERGFRSTYFVMAGRLHPEDAAYDPAEPRMRRLINSLHEAGCEIALHGSFGTCADTSALRKQKEKLEGILGSKIVGQRNHVLRFKVPGSWQAHQEAGFSYDGTLGFADREGFRGCHAFPFHPYDATSQRALDLIEIPLAVMDVTLHKYRRLRDEEAWMAIAEVLSQTQNVGGLATLLWHNDTFYDPDYPGCGRLYLRALDWLASQEVWVAPCAEVDRWWRAREAAEIRPLADGSNGWELAAGHDLEGLVLRLTLPGDAAPEISGDAPVQVKRDGMDYLLTFGRLTAGAPAGITWR